MVEEPRIAIRGADTAILGTQQMPLSKHQFASFNLKSIVSLDEQSPILRQFVGHADNQWGASSVSSSSVAISTTQKLCMPQRRGIRKLLQQRKFTKEERGFISDVPENGEWTHIFPNQKTRALFTGCSPQERPGRFACFGRRRDITVYDDEVKIKKTCDISFAAKRLATQTGEKTSGLNNMWRQRRSNKHLGGNEMIKGSISTLSAREKATLVVCDSQQFSLLQQKLRESKSVTHAAVREHLHAGLLDECANEIIQGHAAAKQLKPDSGSLKPATQEYSKRVDHLLQTRNGIKSLGSLKLTTPVGSDAPIADDTCTGTWSCVAQSRTSFSLKRQVRRGRAAKSA